MYTVSQCHVGNMLLTLAQFGSIHSEWRNELSPQGLVGSRGREESHGCWLDQVSFLEWCPISEIQTRGYDHCAEYSGQGCRSAVLDG